MWLAPALWSIYIALPVRGWGLLGGIPIGPLAAATLVAVWLARASPRMRSPIVPLTLIALKAGVGSLAVVDRGLVAEYYANESLTPPVERSTEYRDTTFTRIDPAIDFGPSAPRDLPLFFLNDLGRFNYFQPAEPDRNVLAYSVSWTGNLLVSRDDAETVVLRGHGIRSVVVIDGRAIVVLEPGATEARGPVTLRSGWRRLRVTASGAYGAQRSFYAGLIDALGQARAFGEEDVFVHRPAAWRLTTGRIVRQASRLLDLLVVSWVAVNASLTAASALVTSPARAAGTCLAIGALIDAVHVSIGKANRLIMLPGGDDPLTYETYARDLLLNGPLMTFGRPLGQGEAFYYQPLYPYVVALLHRVFGEDFFGVFFVQRLLVGVSVALVWRITRRLFGQRIGFAGLGLAVIVLYGKMGQWSATLLSEIVFIPLVCLWACLLIEVSDAGGSATAWRAGVAGGLATLARSTLLLAWPFVAAVVAMARKRFDRSTSVLGTMMVAGLIVLSVATARNWIVARTFVPVTTSFGVNFYLGNRPPERLEGPIRAVAERPLLKRIVPDDRTRMALAFGVQAPAVFARNLLNKALYTLGFFGAFVAGAHTAPALVALWAGALAGVLALWTLGVDEGLNGWVRAIPGIIAVSHFASVVIMFPHHDRLILPFYVLILPYVATIVAVVRRLPIRAGAACRSRATDQCRGRSSRG